MDIIKQQVMMGYIHFKHDFVAMHVDMMEEGPDADKLLEAGRVLESLVNPEPPTTENWKEVHIPVLGRAVFDDEELEFVTEVLEEMGELVEDEGLFERLVNDLRTREELPLWGKELLAQAEMEDALSLYLALLPGGSVEHIQHGLYELVGLTHPDPEDENLEDEVLSHFTREQQERFNATLPRLDELGIYTGTDEAQDITAFELSRAGEKYGYFEGFTV